MSLEAAERSKYERMYEQPGYRVNSPGLRKWRQVLELFNDMGLNEGNTLIDFGCGTGRAAHAFGCANLKVTGVDISSTAPDDMEEPKYTFIRANLWDLPAMNADWGFCVDVMEHIPEEKVEEVLTNIARSAAVTYFEVAMGGDGCGKLIGEELHVTQRPRDWWKERLDRHFDTVVTMETSVGHCAFVASGHQARPNPR